MKNKKLLSTVVASSLAATMAMPVMAADGGKVDVDFTTKTPVIRVEVPTSILAAVDPLEMADTGTQIHSGDFTLVNKSEVPVGIDVESVVDLGTGVTLVDTKKKAVDSTDKTKSEAWLAVAAEVAANDYAGTGKTIADLTETDKNVTTFETVTENSTTKSSASQTFYLDKAASGTTTYKIAAPVATPTAGSTEKTAAQYKEELTYAQVYKLTDITTGLTEATLLNTLKTQDVYECASTGTDDGKALTLIPAGSTSVSGFDATTKKYYTAGTVNALTAEDTDTANKLADGSLYVYGEGGAGEGTAFRYIGKLGKGKNSWSDSDIAKMHINYSIYGLTSEDYTAAEPEHGLYISGPRMNVSATGLITITGLSEDANFAALRIKNPAGTFNANDDAVTWGLDNYSETTGGSCTCQLGDGWMSSLAGQTGCEVYLDLTNNTTITVAISIPASNP